MDRDLLPWILGGALVTTGAIAAAIQFSSHAPAPAMAMRASAAPNAPGSAAPNGAASAPASSQPAAAPAVAAADTAAAPPPPAPVAVNNAAPPLPPAAPSASAPALPSGEVWECTVNGQKIFSDKRCGSGASVKQLGDLNVMDVPPPQYPTPHAYGQPYGAYPAAAPYPDDEDGGDVNGDAYPSQIIVARERARREHRLHQDYHVRPSAPAPTHGGSAPRSPH